MTPLDTLVAEELAEPVDPRVADMAAALAAIYPRAARAVLFYGSCLRSTALDGEMLDFYLIVSDYEAAYGKSWLVRANALVPPNVFPFEHAGLAAKYAVLSDADFVRLNRPETVSVSVWARFAQPARLTWSAGPDAARRVAEAVAGAAPTLLAAARPMIEGDRIGDLDLWRRAFALTYSAELRAERTTRAASVVDFDPARYRCFTMAALAAAGIAARIDGETVHFPPIAGAARRSEAKLWAKRRRMGKALSAVRLAKATGTYAGGIDYIAWKINRHAGTDIAIKPWQRRWPLLGAITLLPRLLLRGAIR